MLKLQFVIDAVDKATSKLTGINKAVEKSVERATAPYRKLRASINGLVENSGLDKLQGAFDGVKSRIAALPGVAALSMGGAFAVMVSTIRRIDEMGDASKKLNVPIQQFQRLGYAAQMSGSSEQDMAASLQFLSQNMVEAINGSKEMQLWFTRVGLSVQQLRRMNAVQVFEAIADRFEKVGNGGQNAEKKIALTRALMGRGGAEMIQMLNQGSKAFQALYDEADKFGTLTEEQAGQFADTADNLDRFEFSLRGLLASITRIALPGLDAMLKKVADMNAASRAELGDKIGRFLSAVIEKMPKVLASLGQIAKGLIVLLGIMDTVAQAFGGWDTLMVVFASVMGAKGVWAVFEMVKAIGILSGALALTPLGWFLLAVGAIAGAVYLVYKNWEPIKKWFTDLWDGIVKKFEWARDKVTGWLPEWMKSGANHAYPVSTAVGRASAVPQAVGSPIRPELGGTLKIEIDGDGKPRVREMRKAPGSVMDFDVYGGAAMGMP
ncbi:hypothetical protein ACG04Q_11815 [Roseateles sp. DXS20W]|uniref:Phage tail tape measure protein n=1 Tax=Pelomonas lactea TaxID=3299030 RepID=A0ABW7GK85_9BURK